MNGEFRLSIVIVTYNRYKDLVDCLDSIMKMNYPPNEIIVVDSSSDDDTWKTKEQYPIRFVSIKEKSMVKARNIGSSLAEGDIIAFLDDDVLVHRQWSQFLLEAYSSDKIGGVGGRVIPNGEKEDYHYNVKKVDVGKIFKTGLVIGNYDTPLESPVEVDALIGCNMSFRKDVMNKTGGFDENFTGNCFRDDTDYCIQVRKQGYKLIYEPKALVWHKFKGKTVDPKWVYWYSRNNTYFYFKDIFSQSRLRIGLFFYRMLFPPRDYVMKSGIRIKPSLTTLALALKGIMDGIVLYNAKRAALI
jgi:GT2 family glycosyltransferase